MAERSPYDRLVLVTKDDPEGKETLVYFDYVSSEQQQLKSQIPDHPLDTGRSVNDHTIIQPRTLSIQASTTETPLASQASPNFVVDLQVAEALDNPTGRRVVNIYPTTAGGSARTAEVNEGLARLQGRLLDVYTVRHGLLEDYELNGVTMSINGARRAEDYSLSLKHVQFASPELVILPLVPSVAKLDTPPTDMDLALGIILGEGAGNKTILKALEANPGAAAAAKDALYKALTGSFGGGLGGVGGFGGR